MKRVNCIVAVFVAFTLPYTQAFGDTQSLMRTMLDPANRRGSSITHGIESADAPPLVQDLLQSFNFEIGIPLLNLAGRGLPVSLSLNYNSRVFMQDGPDPYYTNYNVDGDWLAPGWSLGFGAISVTFADSTPQTPYVILGENNGTRREIVGPWQYLGPDSTRPLVYDGTPRDNTATDVHVYLSDGTLPSSGRVSYQDGTIVDYGAESPYSWPSPPYNARRLYPTKILDRNGNYITITYLSNQGPLIDQIVDTLGAVPDYWSHKIIEAT